MRHALIALALVCSLAAPAAFAQLSIYFGGPGVSIGINLPVYPTLQRVPGYPVYYSPRVNANYFFYDGLYWVFEEDDWYASSWYNGPWYRVDRFDVPVYLLRVPVRYYRHAPTYFRSWRADAPPLWGEHWGGTWEQRRSGWDRWDRRSAPAPAPLPTYQRQYSGNRYPEPPQQAAIQSRSYRYQPRDPVARQHFQQQRAQVQEAPPQSVAPQRQQQPIARQQTAPREQVAPRQPSVTREQMAPRQPAEQPRPQQAQEARQPRQEQPTRQQAQAPAPRAQQAPGQQIQRAEPRAQQQAPGQQIQRGEPRAQQQAPAARGQPQSQPQAAEGPGERRGQRMGQDKGQGKGKDQDQGKGRETD